MTLSAENEVQIQKSIQKLLSSFLISSLPDDVNVYIKPFVPERISHQFYQMSDLKNYDLYCNLRVFVGNYRFLLDAQVISDNTILNCAKIILNWRNKIAHRSPKSDLLESYEQTFFEIMAINRFFSLLPIETKNNEEIDKIKKETINLSYQLSKSYFETEQKASELDENQEDSQEFNEKSTNILENIKYNEEDEDLPKINEKKLTRSEALQLLRKLRQEISEKYPEMPKFRNILRDSILETFLNNRITNASQFEEIMPKSQFLKTDPKQFEYFHKIKEIIVLT